MECKVKIGRVENKTSYYSFVFHIAVSQFPTPSKAALLKSR